MNRASPGKSEDVDKPRAAGGMWMSLGIRKEEERSRARERERHRGEGGPSSDLDVVKTMCCQPGQAPLPHEEAGPSQRRLEQFQRERIVCE